ncbi:hypothetical protein [Enterococcus thailandicus]|uniref:hypothetical protein n=1 Tax=Enterococcus thailandicus TaxID=417368 RepID=UPI0022E2F7AB|nr:hypothetical protein [Enterococcus thailandicus]
MKISDWIQVVAIVVSLIVSSISIYLSNKAIKQTDKNIQDSNRPYVSIYSEVIDTVTYARYLVIKNFGQTSAKIEKLNFEGLENDQYNGKNQLQSLVGSTIAPGQKFATVLDSENASKIYSTIHYKSNDGTLYVENYDVKLDQTADLLWQKAPKSKDGVEGAITNAAHAIVKTLK